MKQFLNRFRSFIARRISPGMLFMPLHAGQDLLTPENFNSLVNANRGYVYICANKNSNTVAQAKLRLYVTLPKGKKAIVQTRKLSREALFYVKDIGERSNIKSIMQADNIEEVLEHPLINLLRNVNPVRNKFDLWDETELDLELVGNSYWYLINNNFGVPAEIWRLLPERTTIIPGAKNFIDGYNYQQPSGEKITFKEEEVIHFRFSNPKDLYYGISPLAAIADAYNIGLDINKYQKTLFKNMGRPEGFLHTEQSLAPGDFERLGKAFQASFGGADKIGLTPAFDKGVKYVPVSNSPRDLHFLQGDERIKSVICNAYGQNLGMYDKDATRANSEQAEKNYIKQAIIPRLRRLEEKLNEKLTPRYDEHLTFIYDSPIPEDKDFKLKERESNLKTGYSVVNQERMIDGKEPQKDYGDKPLFLEPSISGRGNQLGSDMPSKAEQKKFVDEIVEQVKKRLA